MRQVVRELRRYLKCFELVQKRRTLVYYAILKLNRTGERTVRTEAPAE